MFLSELKASALVTDLLKETERIIQQYDEYKKTGVSTAGSGGAYDTCFSTILRKHGVIE